QCGDGLEDGCDQALLHRSHRSLYGQRKPWRASVVPFTFCAFAWVPYCSLAIASLMFDTSASRRRLLSMTCSSRLLRSSRLVSRALRSEDIDAALILLSTAISVFIEGSSESESASSPRIAESTAGAFPRSIPTVSRLCAFEASASSAF